MMVVWMLAGLWAACGGPTPLSDVVGTDEVVATDDFAGGSEAATPRNRRPSEMEGREPEPDPTSAQKSAYGKAMIRGEAALYSGRFEVARTAYLEAMGLRSDAMAPALGVLRSMVTIQHAEARTGIAGRIRTKIKVLAAREETQGAAFLLASRLSLALGDVGRALDESRLAVQRLPELGVAWRVLGEAALAAELWGEAIAAMQTAVGFGLEAKAGTWERLADAHDELGHVAQAERAARVALEMTGSDPNARRRRLNLLATVLKHGGKLALAREAAESARLLGPDDLAVLHNLGGLAEAQNRPEQALDFYVRATSDVPVPMTLWRLGHLYLKLDRPTDAAQAFTKSAGHLDRWAWPASTRWFPAYEVGKIYARAKHFRRAIGWFEDALREALTAEATREIISWLGFVKTQAVDEVAAP
ncbi:MAG: tetratricopeptide (TPR) repeat protein [Myxococcota bacterium]|jgi:tetratricopeptide (TPR) repeat protein